MTEGITPGLRPVAPRGAGVSPRRRTPSESAGQRATIRRGLEGPGALGGGDCVELSMSSSAAPPPLLDSEFPIETIAATNSTGKASLSINTNLIPLTFPI